MCVCVCVLFYVDDDLVMSESADEPITQYIKLWYVQIVAQENHNIELPQVMMSLICLYSVAVYLSCDMISCDGVRW